MKLSYNSTSKCAGFRCGQFDHVTNSDLKSGFSQTLHGTDSFGLAILE